jgi:hypothetical protein
MATTEQPPQHTAGSMGFLTRKLGPLPTWIWMALALLAALAFSLWQKNKAAASAATDTADTASVPDQTPPNVFQTYVYDTDINTPPSGGRQHPPSGPPIVSPPAPVPTPTPPAVTGPVTKPGGSPQPVPAPAGNGFYVPIAKYTTQNPPWNSTLSGISAHLKASRGWNETWQQIWADPKNASLKSRRKDPKLIQPGDQVWVHN